MTGGEKSRFVIDGLLVTGSAFAVSATGSFLRLFQNGLVRFYAWSFTIGFSLMILIQVVL